MSVFYDFENFATDPDAVVPPELNPSGAFGSQGVLAFPTSAYEPIFGAAPDPSGNGNIVGLSMHTTNPGESVFISFSATFPSGGQVEFDWATHGTPGDSHYVIVDGAVEAGGVDAFDAYTHPVVVLAPGPHVVQITMTRGDGEALSDDYGNGMLLDNLLITGVDALDQPTPGTGASIAYTFESGSISADFAATAHVQVVDGTTTPGVPLSGSKVLQLAGAFVASSTRSVQLSVTYAEAGTVEFDSLVSSEQNYDFGHFTIDGAATLDETGSQSAYTHHSYPVAAGDHVLRWAYTKDDSADSAVDSWFLDNITLTGVDATGLAGEPGVEPPAPVGYGRGKIVRHKGGLYLSLVANVLTEPGPGDSEDWLELRVQTTP